MSEPIAPSRAQSSSIAGLQVRHARRGATAQPGDLPVLVLHGWGAHLEAVEPILQGLDTETEVLALDLPGFGESEPPPEAWDSDDYARFVREYLDAQGVERCHLVGHSFGGRVSICLAAEHAERVGRLLLVDSAGLRPRRTMRYRRRVAIAKAGRVVGRLGPPGRRLQKRMRARVASRDYLEAPEAMRATFRAVVAEDLADRLPRIRASTLLVWGELDDDTPPWMGERMEALIPDAALVVLPGAGHYSYAHDPGRFGRIAYEFLVLQPRAA